MVKYLNTIFGSLSDATRRDILERLSGGEMTITEIAKAYDMTLPAISKHLGVLEHSDLIVRERRGRQNFIRLSPDALQIAGDYLEYYESVLDNRLDSFRVFVDEKTSKKSAPRRKKKVKPQEMTLTHVLNADPETVWRQYTDPKSVMSWWGPSGTQLLSCENDVRVGGVWRFVLQGTDGNSYVFSGTYTNVSWPNKLVYSDGIGEPNSSQGKSHVTVTFEALPGHKTRLTKKTVAPPAIHQLHAAWLKAAGSG
jgi:uncharacterized protein YndB with AHSA1/START domain/DNA-binding transcriptional ArsR family regulator